MLEERKQAVVRAATARQQEAAAFAERIKALGFAVYIAESGEYGFITDDTESRVLCFGFGCAAHLSGNYGPPSTTSGTGWRMEEDPSDLRTAEDVKRALYALAPAFAGKGWKHYTTVAQHLATYQASSRYVRA